MSDVDETSLRRLLDSALAQEPPMGPVAHRSLQAGMRLRRRRRARNATAGVAAAAVIAVAIPAVMGTLGQSSGGSRTGSHEVVLYIGSDHKDTVARAHGGSQSRRTGRPSMPPTSTGIR
jgi:hypothetical protein